MKSFTEVLFEQFEKQLGQKIQGDLHSQKLRLQSEIIDTDPSCLSQILGQTKVFKAPFGPKKYPTPRRSQPIPKPHDLTPEQFSSLQFFTSWGESLTGHFSKQELKAAFRRLAKKLHPDLSRQSSEVFMQLKASFLSLEKVFNK